MVHNININSIKKLGFMKKLLFILSIVSVISLSACNRASQKDNEKVKGEQLENILNEDADSISNEKKADMDSVITELEGDSTEVQEETGVE